MAEIRARVPFLDQDRTIGVDIEALHGLISEGWFHDSFLSNQGLAFH